MAFQALFPFFGILPRPKELFYCSQIVSGRKRVHAQHVMELGDAHAFVDAAHAGRRAAIDEGGNASPPQKRVSVPPRLTIGCGGWPSASAASRTRWPPISCDPVDSAPRRRHDPRDPSACLPTAPRDRPAPPRQNDVGVRIDPARRQNLAADVPPLACAACRHIAGAADPRHLAFGHADRPVAHQAERLGAVPGGDAGVGEQEIEGQVSLPASFGRAAPGSPPSRTRR